MKAKRAAGYEWGPKPSESPKQSPYLVPWKELHPGMQYVDRQMIEAIPAVLTKAHCILVKEKKPSPPRRSRGGNDDESSPPLLSVLSFPCSCACGRPRLCDEAACVTAAACDDPACVTTAAVNG